jgi:hypothetical protein
VVGVPLNVNADAAQAWIDNWSTSLTEQAARAKEMSRQVAELSVSAGSSDGAIEVTVGGSGVVTDLRLGELVRKRPADEIAADILTVMRRAQATLGAAVAEIAGQTVGADSQIARAVVAGYEERYPGMTGEEGDPRSGGSASDWRRRGR